MPATITPTEPSLVTLKLHDLQASPFCHSIAAYQELYELEDLTALPLEQQQEIVASITFCDVCSRWFDAEDPCPYH